MKTIGLTVLFCLAVTPASAQDDSEPEYPKASSSAVPATRYKPAPIPAFGYNSQGRRLDRTSGFHISIGTGFAGGGSESRPGVGTQFKIGYRLDADWVVYYYALNDWYRTSPSQAYWRIAAINGVGIDYFVAPKLGVRFAVGVGADTPANLSETRDRKRYLGYSYVMGLTCELGNDENHFSIDPAIHLLQTSKSTNRDHWETYPYFLLTANWVLN